MLLDAKYGDVDLVLALNALKTYLRSASPECVFGTPRALT